MAKGRLGIADIAVSLFLIIRVASMFILGQKVKKMRTGPHTWYMNPVSLTRIRLYIDPYHQRAKLPIDPAGTDVVFNGVETAASL